MKIHGNQGLLVKKIGHCCLVVEVNGVKIMTDPGVFSTEQETEMGINFVLITHEHGDHLHVESLKKVLENNPECKVITNNAVKKLLDAANIVCEILEEGNLDLNGINLFAKTCEHAEITPNIPRVENTGYMIHDRFFYPGDAFLNPGIPVEILALPVVAPWCKTSEVWKYALEIKPKHAFPVHDAIYVENVRGMVGRMIGNDLKNAGISFQQLDNGESLEF